MPTALITGASRGLGFAVGRELADRGWELIVDARDGTALRAAATTWSGAAEVTTLPGDVTDAAHRQDLAAAVRRHGHLDLLVNNASTLGRSPLPPLAELPIEVFVTTLDTNVVAPLALVQAVLPALERAGGTIVNVSSDAAVQPYETWGGYGSSKAALDQLTAILGAEHPDLAVYAFDPGDLRTTMHQEAFPDEDISDRPEPETVVPGLLGLIEQRPPSGRYRAADLVVGAGVAGGGGSA